MPRLPWIRRFLTTTPFGRAQRARSVRTNRTWLAKVLGRESGPEILRHTCNCPATLDPARILVSRVQYREAKIAIHMIVWPGNLLRNSPRRDSLIDIVGSKTVIPMRPIMQVSATRRAVSTLIPSAVPALAAACLSLPTTQR